MGLIRVLLCLTILGITAGCSHSGTQQNSHYRSIPAQTPKVTFVRNQNQSSSAVVTSISINNWMVGTLAPGEHLTMEYPAGHHRVSVKGHSVPLTFKNDREYYFLINQSDTGEVKSIRSILAKDAAQYMESSNYHTSR